MKRKFGENTKFHEVRISLKNNFYKDDYLKSMSTEQEAIQPAEHLSFLCNKGRFTLSKWISDNCESIPLDARDKETKELDLDRQSANGKSIGSY